jgi:hypothetical protein
MPKMLAKFPPAFHETLCFLLVGQRVGRGGGFRVLAPDGSGRSLALAIDRSWLMADSEGAIDRKEVAFVLA